MKCEESYFLEDRIAILEKNIEILVEKFNDMSPQLSEIWEKLGCRPIILDFDD